MKCDKLKEIFILEGHYTGEGLRPVFVNCLAYGKEEVDEAIAELKRKLHDAEMKADLAEWANTEYRKDVKKLKEENEILKGREEIQCDYRGHWLKLKGDYDKLKEENERLKDKCRMHDFFWEGNGFDKMGFKNAIQVREYIDELKEDNEKLTHSALEWELKHDALEKENERLKNSISLLVKGDRFIAEELRSTRRALWLARAERAKAVFHWWLGTTCAPITEKACNKWQKVEQLCRAKAEEYK